MQGMTPETDTGPRLRVSLRNPASRSEVVGVILLVGLVGLVRLILDGWEPLSPDDSRYIIVGQSLLAGEGPITEFGDLWLIRSPLYPLLLALGGLFWPGPASEGAHLVAAVFAAGVATMVVLNSNRIANRVGTLAAGLGLFALPLVWDLLPTVRIDLAQAFFVLISIWLLLGTNPRKWALAGIAVGVAVLVKETAVVLALLPAAFVTRDDLRSAASNFIKYLIALGLTVSVWWVYVFSQTGEIYLLTAERVSTLPLGPPDTEFGWVTIVGFVLGALSWAVVGRLSVRSESHRLLLLAAGLFIPQSVLAWSNGWSHRQHLILSLLTLIAFAAGVDWLLTTAASAKSRPAVIIISSSLLLVGVLGALAGQASVREPLPPPTEVNETVRWLESTLPEGSTVSLSFRHRSLTALELGPEWEIVQLPVWTVPNEEDWSEYLWIGKRGPRLFGLPRAGWQNRVHAEDVEAVAVFWPHSKSPAEVARLMASDRKGAFGIADTMSFDGHRFATVSLIDHTQTPDLSEIPLHIDADAILLVLEESPERLGSILSLEPIVTGPSNELRLIEDEMPDSMCFQSAGEPYTQDSKQIESSDCTP